MIERFERWESDAAEPAVVSVDALAAAGSNEFSDDSVKREDDGQVTIMKEAGQGFFGYKWLGSAAPGMHVVRAFANGEAQESSRRRSSDERRPAWDRGRTVRILSSSSPLSESSPWVTATRRR